MVPFGVGADVVFEVGVEDAVLPLLGDVDGVVVAEGEVAGVEVDAEVVAADLVVQLQEGCGGVGEPAVPDAVDGEFYVAGSGVVEGGFEVVDEDIRMGEVVLQS